jgi:hypothetical protein
MRVEDREKMRSAKGFSEKKKIALSQKGDEITRPN